MSNININYVNPANDPSSKKTVSSKRKASAEPKEDNASKIAKKTFVLPTTSSFTSSKNSLAERNITQKSAASSPIASEEFFNYNPPTPQPKTRTDVSEKEIDYNAPTPGSNATDSIRRNSDSSTDEEIDYSAPTPTPGPIDASSTDEEIDYHGRTP